MCKASLQVFMSAYTFSFVSSVKTDVTSMVFYYRAFNKGHKWIKLEIDMQLFGKYFRYMTI